MNPRLLRRLAIIGFLVLIVDWILGVMCASGILPGWAFVVPNVPFGAIYVWMESSWTGTHYEMLGRTVGDIGSLLVFLGVVAAQSVCYLIVYEWLSQKRAARAAS